jgi:hypothetical protein
MDFNPDPLEVLMAFWRNSHDGRLHLASVMAPSGLTQDDVLAVFRRCAGVFRKVSTSDGGLWECLCTPPQHLGTWERRDEEFSDLRARTIAPGNQPDGAERGGYGASP